MLTKTYGIERIGEKIYKINEFGLSTMFIIVGEKQALAIDCGTGVADYMSLIRRVTDLPLVFAVTHAHVDHIGGRGQFIDMRISPEDETMTKDVNTLYRKFYFCLNKLQKTASIPLRETSIDKIINEPEHLLIQEGDIIDLGGRTVKVISTPGHTKGSLSYLLVEDRILFSGDVLNENNLLFLKGATPVAKLGATIAKVKALDGWDTIWASHYDVPLRKDALDRGLECIWEICRKKNSVLPLVAIKNYKNFRIIYRTDRIH